MNKEQFLNMLCEEIKYKKVRASIVNEYTIHIEETASNLIKDGISPDEANRLAVERLGDPKEIGKALNLAHRPHMEWSIFILIAALINISTYVLYYLNNLSGNNLFDAGKLFVIIIAGVIALLVGLFFDYTKLLKISAPIFTIISLMLILRSILIHDNNYNIWIQVPLLGTINAFSCVTPMLIILYAGVLAKYCNRGSAIRHAEVQIKIHDKNYIFRGIPNLFILYAITALPVIAYISTPRFLYVSVLFIAFVSMVFYAMSQKEFVGKRLKYISTISLGGILSAFSYLCWMAYTRTFVRGRLMSALNPSADISGAGYQINMTRMFISTSELFGRATAEIRQAPALVTKFLPSAHSDLIFTSIVATFGWVFAVGVLLLYALLIWRVALMVKRIRDYFGRLLIIGVCAAFSFQIITHVLVAIGLLPSISMPLPFLSFGITSNICNMAMIGLILSVYRRKDLI